MHVGATPEGPLEWLAFKLAPLPIADTHVAFTAARAIMAGTSLGIFDAIARGARTAPSIAWLCATDPRATRALVDCLVALGYLHHAPGRYANSRRVEKWLLARSPASVRDKILFQSVEWNMLAKLEDFVRTGAAGRAGPPPGRHLRDRRPRAPASATRRRRPERHDGPLLRADEHVRHLDRDVDAPMATGSGPRPEAPRPHHREARVRHPGRDEAEAHGAPLN